MSTVMKDTKVLVRAMGQFYFNFPENAKLVVFKDLGVLSDQDPDKDEIFIGSPKSRHEDTQLGFWPNSKGLEWRCQNKAKIHYSQTLFGDF
jgi:hypothetical protein